MVYIDECGEDELSFHHYVQWECAVDVGVKT